MSTATIAPVTQAPDLPSMATDALLRADENFPRRPAAISNVRSWLGKTLADWGVPEDDAYTAQLLLSEIATNAVVHAGGNGDFRVHVYLYGVELGISVYDPDPGSSLDIPEQRDSAESGRGLLILKALSRRCGVDRTDTEKRTWFTLMIGDA